MLLCEFCEGARDFIHPECEKGEGHGRCAVDEAGMVFVSVVWCVSLVSGLQVVADQIELEKKREEELQLLYQ
jgi:hypothetical protein